MLNIEGFKLTEEEIAFIPEQLDKISQLRRKKEGQCPTYKKDLSNDFRDLREGSLVYVFHNNFRAPRVILNIRKGTSKKLSDSLSFSTTDVKTAYGTLKNVSRYNLWKRERPDYSGIKIPEILSKMSAPNLLKLLSQTYNGSNWGIAYHNGKQYNSDEIKAALVGKPQVPNKRERLAFESYIAKNK